MSAIIVADYHRGRIKVVITVEIYKQIRKMRLQGMSQRQIATSLQISRNTVKKYWDGDSVPWERKNYSREATILTENVVAFVRHCLEEDTRSPKKQRHTAKRIYDRLVDELGFTGGETTVRRLVSQLRKSTKRNSFRCPSLREMRCRLTGAKPQYTCPAKRRW